VYPIFREIQLLWVVVPKKSQLWINFAILCRNNRSISNHWGKESLGFLRIPQIDWHKRAQRASAVVFLCWLNPYVRWIGHWNVVRDYTKPPLKGGFLKWGILKTMAFNTTTVVYFGWFGVPPHFRKHIFFEKKSPYVEDLHILSFFLVNKNSAASLLFFSGSDVFSIWTSRVCVRRVPRKPLDPSSLAKLVNITPITFGFMTHNYSMSSTVCMGVINQQTYLG